MIACIAPTADRAGAYRRRNRRGPGTGDPLRPLHVVRSIHPAGCTRIADECHRPPYVSSSSRLTDRSPRLVWRANHPSGDALARYRELLAAGLTSPMKMEIFLAGAGGRDVRQLTDFGCASFAPTFTPDGKKILFFSNKHDCDGRRFELYLMNLDGTGLEQVTRFGGFTSFPEFSPDGRKLVFSSDLNATGRYEFNIFTADWR
ncbi:MAG: PD40 domain-containing protein [Bryobacteraceae bacterium]|nr:PD40 domain-containing protein [Bryobacteraceae bacterium]